MVSKKSRSTSRLRRLATWWKTSRSSDPWISAASPSPGSRHRRSFPAGRRCGLLGHPARGGQLGGGRQGAVGDQGEEHPLGGLLATSAGKQPAQERVDAQPPPEAVEGVGAAQAARLKEGKALAARGSEGRPREPGSATARPPGARSPPGSPRPRGRSCRSPGPASALYGVPDVVRQLQVADRRAVLVPARCGSQVHAYMIARSTCSCQGIVCLQLFAFGAPSKTP